MFAKKEDVSRVKMIWQDLVISAANVIFAISLIPQVFYGFKKKLGLVTIATSLPSFLGLCAISNWFIRKPRVNFIN